MNEKSRLKPWLYSPLFVKDHASVEPAPLTLVQNSKSEAVTHVKSLLLTRVMSVIEQEKCVPLTASLAFRWMTMMMMMM